MWIRSGGAGRIVVYLLLVGCGKLLLPVPGASRVAPVAMVVVGLAVAGSWWRSWAD